MQRRTNELTGEQSRALELLLNAATPARVARELGVNRSTVHRWLQHPVFVEALADDKRYHKANGSGATDNPAQQPADGLTDAQREAVALLVAGATHAEVAATVGVHRCTVTLWCSRNPAFKAALAAARRAQLDAYRGRAAALVDTALAALGSILGDAEHPHHARAALEVLRRAGVLGLAVAPVVESDDPRRVELDLAKADQELEFDAMASNVGSWRDAARRLERTGHYGPRSDA